MRGSVTLQALCMTAGCGVLVKDVHLLSLLKVAADLFIALAKRIYCCQRWRIQMILDALFFILAPTFLLIPWTVPFCDTVFLLHGDTAGRALPFGEPLLCAGALGFHQTPR